MADLSVMSFLNEETQQETEYNLKDAQARSNISTLNGKIGSANGIAELDSNGRVPSSQLPSYVDDVLEYASQSAFPATGETGKIYIALDTNKTFRWSGSAYVEISESLALGETSSTAYAGNKGKANADAITAMKDGSSIDSFGDVETALNGKSDFFTLSGKLEWDEDMVTHEKILHGSYTPTVTANNENPVTSKGVYNFAFPRDEQAVLGAKNINATDYSKASALTNITATFNNDGTITANGTTTANESLAGGSAANFKAWYTGSVRIASAPENVLMTLYDATAGANVGIAGQTCNMTAGHDYRLSITFLANKTFTNVVVNPLIVLATDLDDTPAPYAMTNKELTDEIKEMFLPVKMKDGYFEDWTFGIHDADTLGAGGVAEISNGNAANISHLPSEVSVACSLYTISPFNNYYRQFCLMRDSIDIYVRIKTSGNAYGNWHKFGITQV